MFSLPTIDHVLDDILASRPDNHPALMVCDATDPALSVISVNDAFTALTGYRASEAVGREWNFLRGPLTNRNEVACLRKAAGDGVHASAILIHYRRDGSHFLNEVAISPVHDQTGAVRFHTLVHREMGTSDGTAATKRRVRFGLLPDRALVPIAVPDGMPVDWLDRVSPGDRARLAHAAQSCAARGSDLTFALRIANAAGVENDAVLRACRVTDPARTDHIIYEGGLSDLSSAMMLASRLRLLESVMTHANDAILITEAEPLDGPGPRILYVSNAITHQTGYQPDQLIGRTPRILQGPLTDPVERLRFGSVLRRWERVTATLLNYRSDGSTFWSEISCAPIADEHGWWTHWISVQRDVTERKEVAEKVAFLADHDPLTGLANRRLADRRLAQELRRAKDEQATCGVVKIDLDRFKPINDTYGHAAGDTVLSEVARRLTSAARRGDTVARIGGDEFMVVVPGLGNRHDLQSAAARLLAGVTGPFGWNDGKKLAIGASIGAALFPNDADEPDRLLVAADAALYRAKAQGRGRVNVFSEELRAETAEMREVAKDLHEGIERDEFVAFFQPKVRLSDRRLIGFEALVRWRHPRKGIIQPGSFLPVAETSGLMRMIDKRVIQLVARTAAQWAKTGIDFGRIAVNVSADSFADPGFVTALHKTLDRAGMDPRRLVVEVVESIFMSDSAGTLIGKLGELRSAGIRIELDDFGTGYAALSHLRTFKVDGIKLDRSFISGVGIDRGDDVIIGAVVGLARNLGIGCVAEGIETERQFDFLRDMGCENGQGYLFGIPAGEASTTAWLRRLAEADMTVSHHACAAE